ncbi:MAG: hypothetical protein R3C53_19710 [Pirellulaceae bacterium]
MFLKIAFSILACIGAVVVLAVLALGVAYFVLVRRLSRRMRETVSNMEAMLSETIDADSYSVIDEFCNHNLVPPMEIQLKAMGQNPIVGDQLAEEIHAWLVKHGFETVGNYRITAIEEEWSVYLSDDQKLVGVIRNSPYETDVYVEFCFDLSDQSDPYRRGGVSNPPKSTLLVPEGAVGKHFTSSLSDDFSLLSRMWLEAKEMIDVNEVRTVAKQDIRKFFENAHAAHMLSRLRAGGVTEQEVRASFRAQCISVSDDDVQEIVDLWQSAICDYLLQRSPKARLIDAAGDTDLVIVFDNINHEFLIRQFDPIIKTLPGTDESHSTGELQTLLDRFPAREAIGRFRPLLPSELRFQLIDTVHEPVESDIYRIPNITNGL